MRLTKHETKGNVKVIEGVGNNIRENDEYEKNLCYQSSA